MNDFTDTQINSIIETYTSKATETEGFDLQAGQTWIYPTNYPVREYQFNIIQEALHKNTLVSLPTGLGKTFIAAVVMYNYFRWYPHGKIIFMAPTRPLVRQQVEACYNVMAIPKETTAELTGTKTHTSRVGVWYNKRVFFITPQVLQNDLDNIVELGSKIKCLIFDEAHKAKGNHAYCEVIRKLTLRTKLFRVLALSATPGNSVPDVMEVMKNLLIAHLEFRTEESLDVKPYIFERSLETIVVPLGDKLTEVRQKYIQILEEYTRVLVKYKVIRGNCSNLTKGKIFMTLKEFQERNRGDRNPNYGEIMKSLNICVTLYHAFELLIRHGLRSFLIFFEEHIDKPLLKGNHQLLEIMEDLRTYLGPPPLVEQLPDGSFSALSVNTKFGHPKFYKLQAILTEHFAQSSKSRVIVFFEYRESVMEAYALLNQFRPQIRPRVFLGQGSGITQKVQVNVVKAFRQGDCNTLLSTCIGEEGLDVGEVDLIICFDISNKSPIRMIQRMGRTGRKREGRIVVLVTVGKEQQTLKDCLIYKHNLGNFVLNSKELMNGFYNENPAMIPLDIQPKCKKMFISVTKTEVKEKTNDKKNQKIIPKNSGLKQGDIRNMFIKTSSETDLSSQLTQNSTDKPSKKFPIELFSELTNFVTIQMTNEKKCKICENLFKCPQINEKEKRINWSEIFVPDASIFNAVTTEGLNAFKQSLEQKSQNTSHSINFGDSFDDIRFTQLGCDKSFTYTAPKSFREIVKNYDVSDVFQEDFMPPPAVSTVIEKQSPDKLEITEISTPPKLKSTDSINSDRSPDLFDEEILVEKEQSPVLSLYYRSQEVKPKSQKRLFGETGPNQQKTPRKPNLKKLTSNVSTPKKITLEIGDICDLAMFGLDTYTEVDGNKVETNGQVENFDISDLCDLSSFGITQNKMFTQNSQSPPKADPKSVMNENLEAIIISDDELECNRTEDKSKSLLSITQALSFINKSENILEKSHKLNTTCDDSPVIQAKKNRKKFNLSITSNSDDEFENVEKSPIFHKPKIFSPKIRKKIHKKKTDCEFIEKEAEVSDDEVVSTDETENENDNVYDPSFIADDSEQFISTQMHVNYLQSIKSPNNRGKFKIPLQPTNNILNVFSQVVNNEDNTYINDSFCVNSDDNDDDGSENLSELEIMEKKLKMMNRKKRRKKNEEECRTKKKRRLIQISSDESD